MRSWRSLSGRLWSAPPIKMSSSSKGSPKPERSQRVYNSNAMDARRCLPLNRYATRMVALPSRGVTDAVPGAADPSVTSGLTCAAD